MKKLIRHPAADRADRPFMIIWEVTQACDLACRHCRASARPEHDPRELTFGEGCDLLDQARSFGDPPPIFIFTGGDPFKREDLFDLVAHAKNVGLVPAVSPSATPLVTKERLQKVLDAGAKVMSLSLDASTAEAHDAFRGVQGSYDLTLKAWRQARELGLKVQINTTVNRLNLEDLADIANLVAQEGAMTWSVFFLVPTGRASEKDTITAQECEAVMHFLVDACRYLNVKTTEGHHFKRIVLQRDILDEKGLTPELDPLYHRLTARFAPGTPPRNSLRRTPMHIGSANGFVFISHLGDVFPSGFLPMRAGNVRERSLVDIYRHSDLFQWLRNPEQLKGRCHDCEFRAVCGGSRSRAFAVHGDPLAEEPFCAYQPGSFPFQEELAARLEGRPRIPA